MISESWLIPEVKVVEEVGVQSSSSRKDEKFHSPTPTPNSNSPSPTPTPFSNSPRHVLVVDDSSVNRSVLTAFMKRAGVASVGQACDGAEAFSELESAAKAGRPYDIVFSDFWMPNMNGLELIDKLRADPRFKGLPVFAVTADTEVRGDARTALFTGVLLKPLTYDKLVDAIASVERSKG